LSGPRLPPAGWYGDPGGEAAHRWWDGERWTDAVSDRDGAVSQSPLPPEGAAAAWAALEDHRQRFNAWFALLAVAMFLVASIVAGTLAYAGDQVSPSAALLLGAVGNYGCLFLTCWWISRWRGTGNVLRDFGIRGERSDWWRGVLVSFGAQVASVVVAAIVAIFSSDLVGSNGDMFDDHKDSVVFLACAAVVAIGLAPIFEELFFRGLVLQSLEGSFPVPVAIAGQGLLFGLAHLGGADGAGNVGLVLSLAAVGTVFGVCARRYHRLVPGMVAHACFNLPSIIILFAGR
jgi:membrane protease YdiL (CAAX protease family)